jgi:6-pyruvoyltetrahydropterin/6-carboxytetrahydropterin synthase
MQVRLRSMHRLWNQSLSETENADLYGQCARVHGHDYHVQITLSGKNLLPSGYLMDRDLLSHILRKHLVEPFDGEDLNQHFQNTSCEALAVEFFNRLAPVFTTEQAHLPVDAQARLIRVAIQETTKNHFFYADPASVERNTRV